MPALLAEVERLRTKQGTARRAAPNGETAVGCGCKTPTHPGHYPSCPDRDATSAPTT